MSFDVRRLETYLAALLLPPLFHVATADLEVLPAPRGVVAELVHAHADGTPCPDGSERPCDSDCACPCCHGRSAAKARTVPPLVAGGGPPRPILIVKPPDLHPVELVERVFRPPRLA